MFIFGLEFILIPLFKDIANIHSNIDITNTLANSDTFSHTDTDINTNDPTNMIKNIFIWIVILVLMPIYTRKCQY